MADSSERDAILANVIGEEPNSQGWVRINCPVCPEKKGGIDTRRSLGYRPVTGGFKCFRCGVSGRMQGEGYVLPEKADAGEKEPVDLSARDDMFRLWDDSWDAESMRGARAFMQGRGFSRRDMRRADVHVDIARHRVVVPHKDFDGEWWGYSARTYVGDIPKLLYPPAMNRDRMFNEHVLFTETPEPVLLMEGCLDTLWYLPRAIAALGKPTDAHFETLLEARRPIAICLDGDAWEEGHALSMRLRLRGVEAFNVRLPAGEDPNTVDPKWLLESARPH